MLPDHRPIIAFGTLATLWWWEGANATQLFDGTVVQPWGWALRMNDNGDGSPAWFTHYRKNDDNGQDYPSLMRPVETQISGNMITAVEEIVENSRIVRRYTVKTTFHEGRRDRKALCGRGHRRDCRPEHGANHWEVRRQNGRHPVGTTTEDSPGLHSEFRRGL
jgi:hypothetical protein